MNKFVIYPNNHKKYVGYIRKYKYSYAVGSNSSKYPKFYVGKIKSYDECIDILKCYALWNNIPIKNVIYKVNNNYYCDVNHNKIMKFDHDDLCKVNEISWFYTTGSRNGYVEGIVNKKQIKFHQYIMNMQKDLDHKNIDKLDNRKCNLRTVDRSTQMFNRKGTKGVTLVNNIKQYGWRAQITVNYKKYTKYYSIDKYENAKYLATQWYNDKIVELRGPVVLNHNFIGII